jgi:uncharacterized membrane-anchored protein
MDDMETTTSPSKNSFLNKVPEVTTLFWIIKMMSTTVGETAADYLSFDLHFGLFKTSLILVLLLVAALFIQVKSKTYTPVLYWITIVLISVFGTLLTDNLTDNLNIPLALSTVVFSVSLGLVFWLWYSKEKTLSIHHVDTKAREIFYWIAILFTFALGTAAGDLAAESLGLGYTNAALLFGALIACSAFAYFCLHANVVACFWISYILTRPLGAAIGDLLSQTNANGGLGLGTTQTSAIFLVTIIFLVGYLSITNQKIR